MARIDNLTNFLEDVAASIKVMRKYENTEKIPAEQFDSEILQIESGIDTSDATAAIDDIIMPKTAYVNGQKITGNIEGVVSYNSPTLENYNTSYSQSFNAIDYRQMLALQYNTTKISIYNVKNDVVDFTDVKCSITNTDIGAGAIYAVTFGNIIEKNKIRLWVWSGTSLSYIICDSTGIIEKYTNNYGWQGDGENYGGHGNELYVNPYVEWEEVAHVGANVTNGGKCNLHVAKFDTDTKSIIKTFTQMISGHTNAYYNNANFAIGSWTYDGWFTGMYRATNNDKNVVILQANNALHESFTLRSSGIQGNNRLALGNNKYCVSNQILNGSTLLTTIDLSIASNIICFVYANYLCIVDSSSNTLNIYDFDGNKLGNIANIANWFCTYDTANLVSTGNKIKALGIKMSENYSKLVRRGITYYDTSDADITAGDVVEGKIGYGKDGKVTGTIQSADTVSLPYSGMNYVIDGSTSIMCFMRPEIGKRYFDNGMGMNMSIPFDELAEHIGLTADKLVEGNTVIGVEGTAKTGGLDTSDATATSNDIVEGKTAYVNGEKITGTLANINQIAWAITDASELEVNTDIIRIMKTAWYNGVFYENTDYFDAQVTFEALAQAIGLTADKIKAGETILGVTGTYEGSGGPITQAEYDQALETANQIKGGVE